MRIAELLRWVGGSAGAAGWPPIEPRAAAPRVAILGGSLAGWSCAAYLALAGCQADVLDSHAHTPAALGAAPDELEAVLALGVRFSGGLQPAEIAISQYAAVYLASGEWAEQADGLARPGRMIAAPAGADCLSPAAAVAAGRTAAFAIFAEVFGKSDA